MNKNSIKKGNLVTGGFSLLELLMACSLSTLVIAGLITIYLGIKGNHNQQRLLTDLEDAGRFAHLILNQRIRLAGLMGCSQTIIGYCGEHLPSALKSQVVPGTDSIVIDRNTEPASMAYYIGDTGRINQGGQPILALFEKPLDGGDRVELAPGIEQMQLLYGVSKHSGEDLSYYKASEITDWQTVRGVQIDLLINSIENCSKKSQSYYFQGQTVTPHDLLLHQAWSHYVALRERTPYAA